jgi:hypothetical protein
MNKYADFSRQCQKIRRAERMCYNKARFDTQETALQRGQKIYSCPICMGWHRSGAFATLAARLSRKCP